MKIKDITKIQTIGSMYNNDSVDAMAKGRRYRIKADQLVKMLHHHPMKKIIAKKAKVHTYLEIE